MCEREKVKDEERERGGRQAGLGGGEGGWDIKKCVQQSS